MLNLIFIIYYSTYSVVAIDLRGYGDSEKPAGKSEYSIQNLVKDIKEIIEGLGRNVFKKPGQKTLQLYYIGYSSCILVSHDWGGVISWRFTALYPEMVEKLIVCNAPHSKAFQIHTRNNPNQLRKSWYSFFGQFNT